ncbi:MAG TPA: hypothetical protein VIY90_16900 [Steroidobacteraceae bacterium]
MKSEASIPSELFVKFSRRSLWIALALILALGGYAIVINVFPNSIAASSAHRLANILPLAITIAVAWAYLSLQGSAADKRGALMTGMLNDELRQHSLNRAYRNGLVAVLVGQPALALLVAWAARPFPELLMASATALIGTSVVLCTMLIYDR